MKVYDLETVINPDNIEIMYFNEDGITFFSSSIAEIVDDVTQQLIDLLLPSADLISKRLNELGIVLDLKVDAVQLNYDIKLDYVFENIDHGIYFLLEESIVTDLGFVNFIINGIETKVYLRNNIMQSGYLYNGFYLIIYDKSTETYNLYANFPKYLGFMSDKRFKDGLYKNLINNQTELYYFTYSKREVSLDLEKSLFFDQEESLLSPTFNYFLKSTKAKIYDEPSSGRKKIYTVIRQTNGSSDLIIPKDNKFIPKNKVLYIYESY